MRVTSTTNAAANTALRHLHQNTSNHPGGTSRPESEAKTAKAGDDAARSGNIGTDAKIKPEQSSTFSDKAAQTDRDKERKSSSPQHHAAAQKGTVNAGRTAGTAQQKAASSSVNEKTQAAPPLTQADPKPQNLLNLLV
jgi:hypothetical protein